MKFAAYFHMDLRGWSGVAKVSCILRHRGVLLPFSGRRHKMTHKDWRVVKPQHNQSYGPGEVNRYWNICNSPVPDRSAHTLIEEYAHNDNTPIQIYRKFRFKNWKFQIKNSDSFYISAQNIDCGYSLEPPRRGGSNEYPKSMFSCKNKKNNVYPWFTI